MSKSGNEGAQRPIWLFMAATAMATTVSTLAATALVKAETAEPEAVAVTCECEAAECPVAEATPEVAEAPVQAPAVEAEATAQAATMDVEGPLDKNIIRRIVRAHINEVRYCYNQGLSKDAELEGRVAVQFKIGAKGSVTESTVVSTTMEDSGVPECIAEAVARWKFPRSPDGEPVVVTYPFVLEPG